MEFVGDVCLQSVLQNPLRIESVYDVHLPHLLVLPVDTPISPPSSCSSLPDSLLSEGKAPAPRGALNLF